MNPHTRQLTLGAAAFFIVTYIVLVCTLPGQLADDRVWSLTLDLPGSVESVLDDFSRRIMPFVSALILLVDSVIRRAWSTIVVGAAATVIATASAFALRNLLPRPTYGGGVGVPANTFPSTHVTLVAAPLLAVVVAIGVRPRVAQGYLLLIAAAMVGNTMHYVHRPADTIGALLLSICVVCGLSSLPRRLRGRRQIGAEPEK